jgi:hypothetical protein
MATSYKKKSATSKKRTKGSPAWAGKASDAGGTIFGSALVGQDPPIIIKPGGSLDITVQNTATSDNLLLDEGIDPKGHHHYAHVHKEKTYKLKKLTFLDIASNKETEVDLPTKAYALLLYYFK